MGKKAEKKQAMKRLAERIDARLAAPRRRRPATRYEVRTLPPAGASGRLGVIEISAQGEIVIARYQTQETAQWVRKVMQDAVKE
ncbi:hypothetical protein MARCHEWKA_03220 [Brevundimonas phage vB_BpoS-Marchewka]|uniref:Uncharacterized protein n=1 Tax=Brevundimonas phage vB_BpoS-Marchewka TaxID=2948604 RepID=A0A9E7SR70_9CAUD|nr:hypothetical protein MARCHEWKA_03220 [Brevundimonas phage vB_BpoS-Marchewka]UTC29281.1 hypothetical protein BAMBUS_01990 [Brevundimonas phage vB_BpoS-Bambus]